MDSELSVLYQKGDNCIHYWLSNICQKSVKYPSSHCLSQQTRQSRTHCPKADRNWCRRDYIFSRAEICLARLSREKITKNARHSSWSGRAVVVTVCSHYRLPQTSCFLSCARATSSFGRWKWKCNSAFARCRYDCRRFALYWPRVRIYSRGGGIWKRKGNDSMIGKHRLENGNSCDCRRAGAGTKKPYPWCRIRSMLAGTPKSSPDYFFDSYCKMNGKIELINLRFSLRKDILVLPLVMVV